MRLLVPTAACGWLLLVLRSSSAAFVLQPMIRPPILQQFSIQRRPRRSLEKRRKRRGPKNDNHDDDDDFPWDSAESRPMVSSMQQELGEDYWVDEGELARYQAKQRAVKPLDPGQIPKEKLWMEVLSPYKDNWIGLISVSIIALSFIFKFFPEVISPPMIVNVPMDL